MISIQSIMLVALGFLSATLLALLIAPAFWRRAVRLTTRRLKEQLPLSDAEIRADKDRLRAEYAIRVHKLEMKVEQANLQKARDLIEINRRDGNISLLEQERSQLHSQVDENQNARRVLEQTVADRLPKVEGRLNEAKQLLFTRDREIAELTQSTSRQNMALEEAHSINAQQTSEIDRLTTSLTVRGARNQDSLADPSFDGELALRSEIEALRSKTREQAGMIGRLQALSGRGAFLALGEAGPAPGSGPVPRNGAFGNGADQRPSHSSVALVPTVDEARMAADREIRALRGKLDDQAADIARLTGELQTFKSDGELSGLKDSKIALKARLNGSQAHAEQNTETIKRLRAEVAAANERLALQGAHFMEQMRRLGAGTLPAAGQTRRPVTQNQKLSLSERVAQSRPVLTSATQRPAAPELEDISTVAERVETVAPADVDQAAAAAPVNGAHAPASAPASASASAPASATVIPLSMAQVAASSHSASSTDITSAEPAEANAQRKPRLVDRISNINKA